MNNEKTQNEPKFLPSIDIAEEEMQELRSIQASSIDSLDTKAGIIIGFIGATIAFVGRNLKWETLLHWKINCIYFGVLVASLINSVKGYWVKGYKFNPKPRVLIDDYMFRLQESTNEKPGAKEQILVDQVKAYEDNEKILDRKALSIKLSLFFLIISIFLLIIILIGG